MATNKLAFPATATEWRGQLGVAVLYMFLLFLSEYLFEDRAFAGHFEPAGGLALAALLIGGMRYTWGVLLGGVLAHLFIGEQWREVVPELAGDTLQAVCGTWLLARSRFDWRVQSLRNYFSLVLLGGGASVTVGSVIVILGFLVSGVFYPEDYLEYLQHWWLGDTLGVVLVTPLILSWWQKEESWRSGREVADAVLLLGMTVLVGQIVFLGWQHENLGGIARSYWMFMFIAWVAMFLGPRGTTLALFVVAVQALSGAMQGVGAFAGDVAASHLVNFWFYMLILSMVGMSLATYFTEIKEANSAVAHRDTLIREIHHRIKNNLQGITGLLCLLAEQHPEAAGSINKTIGQLQNIAAIHGLQERGPESMVRLDELARTVALTVGSLWQRAVDIDIPADGKFYIVEQSEVVPLALVMNELLSNAVKHGDRTGQLKLALESGPVSGSMRLSVCNAGQLRADFERNTGTGLQLVKSLLPRAGARLSWQDRDSTVVAILDIDSPVITLGS